MQKQFPQRKQEGQGLVEYALILVMVSVVVIVILSALGPGVGNIFSGVVTVLNGDSSCSLATPCDGDMLRVDLNVSPPAKQYSFKQWSGSSWVEIELTNSKNKYATNYTCTEGSAGCPS